MCAVHDEETMTEVANVRRRRRCNCVSSAFSRRTSGSARSRIWWPLRVTDKRLPPLHARVNAEVGRACLLPDLISWSAFILSVWDLAWMIISLRALSTSTRRQLCRRSAMAGHRS